MIRFNISDFNGDCLVFCGRNMITRKDGKAMSFDDVLKIKCGMPTSLLFAEPEYDYCAMGVDGGADAEWNTPEDYRLVEMRLVTADCDEGEVVRISRAKAVMEWLRRTRYCGTCGGALRPHESLTAMACPGCGALIFPRIEPCIIVLISKGDEILLLRHARRHKTFYACLAGFMEAGETAEQALRREVMEETGLTVRNIRYFGTQSWPYPAQMMIGFLADYDSGDIKIQESEISDARWFGKDNLPELPRPGSIAYRMIDYVVNGRL